MKGKIAKICGVKRKPTADLLLFETRIAKKHIDTKRKLLRLAASQYDLSGILLPPIVRCSNQSTLARIMDLKLRLGNNSEVRRNEKMRTNVTTNAVPLRYAYRDA